MGQEAPDVLTEEDLEARIQSLPQALGATYSTSKANEDITLYSGGLSLTLRGHASHGEGRVFLKWLPSPEVRLEAQLSEASTQPPLALWVGMKVDLNSPFIKERVLVTSSTISSGTPLATVNGRLERTPPTPTRNIDRVLFHVPNFHPYMGELIRYPVLCTGSRLSLTWRDFHFILDGVSNLNELTRDLKSQGGFAITHTGQMMRRDGSAFSAETMDELLSALFYLLSFCRGLWCGPLLETGFLNGEVVWHERCARHFSGWSKASTWFPSREPSVARSLEALYSGFMELWMNPIWREPLAQVIHLYIDANAAERAVEGRLILAQAALEVLWSVTLVEDPQTCQVQEGGSKELSAGARIKNLLDELSIPTEIPVALTDFASAAALLGAQDGVSAITKLRNAIVHPKKENRGKVAQTNSLARLGALSLSLWYIEMVLLRLCGYEGLYHSRLSGQTEPLPPRPIGE
jgi:hypothetical protein